VSRSFLFVPADSERKLEKAGTSNADALILDLEDSVAAAARPAARKLAAEFLTSHRDAEADVWVRINPLDSADALEDLKAVMPSAPVGIVLPKPRGAVDSNQLAKLLEVLEQENGHAEGCTSILPVATERPAALFSMDDYVDATPRLAGLTWGAEDLSAAVGASTNRDEDGNWLAPYQLARSLCLFAAAAAGVAAIDTVYTDYKDADGMATFAAAARRDGFEGMLAIHPDQVDVINDAFVPTNDETERAQRIVELFAANPGAGTLGMDGEMIDRPHWLQAKRILENANRLK
jgi:citrate lyase subunit beta/citryl-CoA lyase